METAKMDLVKVRKSELLAKLRENLEKHNAILKKAKAQYWVALESRLSKMIERVKQHREVDLYVDITEPQDHSEDYDLAIAMLDMSVDDVIGLTPQEFSKYIMNKWAWRSEFVSTVRGVQGYSGLSGYSGMSGISGWSGIAGPCGTEGTKGFCGFDGPGNLSDLEELLEDF